MAYANSPGGQFMAAYPSGPMCFGACQVNVTCAGADFDILKNECYFHDAASLSNEQFADCCYRLVKPTDGEFTDWSNQLTVSEVRGGSHQQYG